MIYFCDTIAFSHQNGREENQDAYGYMISENRFPDSETNGAVFFVADGVSCSNGGEAAARINKSYRKVLSSLLGECVAFQERAKNTQLSEQELSWEICEKLRDTVLEFDRIVCGKGHRGDIGATISLALVLGCNVYTANLGDSPIFLVELDGDDDPEKLTELYQCHNAAADLPEEEALTSNLKYTLTVPVLGDQPDRSRVYVTSAGLYQNNLLLLGSDGALSVLPKDALVDLIRQKAPEGPEAINSALFDAIREAGETDNYTLIGQWVRTD